LISFYKKSSFLSQINIYLFLSCILSVYISACKCILFAQQLVYLLLFLGTAVSDKMMMIISRCLCHGSFTQTVGRCLIISPGLIAPSPQSKTHTRRFRLSIFHSLRFSRICCECFWVLYSPHGPNVYRLLIIVPLI